MTQRETDRVRELLACSEQRSNRRCCFVLHVKPECLEEYIEVHQHVWEDMRLALSESGWRHYSLFVDEHTGMIVGYFEADNTAAAMDSIACTEVNTRWQEAMSAYFAQPDGGQAHILRQYFYLP